MRFLTLVCVFIVILSCFFHNRSKCVDATFWDGIVGVSQIKSAAQYMTGDKKGAFRTNRNFWNQMPVVSQVKSLGQIMAGHGAEAQHTQAIFLRETITPILDSAPFIGQVKAAIHIMLGGNKDEAYRIIRASTITSVIIGYNSFSFIKVFPPTCIIK